MVLSRFNRKSIVAVQLMSDYKINGVPTVAIDGRFIVSPADLFAKSKVRDGSHAGLVVMDWLVDKAYKEKNPAGAAPVVNKKK